MDTVDTPIRFLRRKYRSTPSLGTVTVQYDICEDGVIDITVDLTALAKDWTRAYLMNEQGANHFVRYTDSNGNDLQSKDIGIWQQVDGTTQWACFSRERGDLVFCVEPANASLVHYGRERYWQRNWRGLYYLSWAGVDLQIDAPREVHRYRITLEVK
jgi:hypothetical protein